VVFKTTDEVINANTLKILDEVLNPAETLPKPLL
jgi:hypothetical protein